MRLQVEWWMLSGGTELGIPILPHGVWFFILSPNQRLFFVFKNAGGSSIVTNMHRIDVLWGDITIRADVSVRTKSLAQVPPDCPTCTENNRFVLTEHLLPREIIVWVSQL